MRIGGMKWLILIAVAIPTITIEMAGTAVFVAFDAIASDLGVSIERSVWLTTMYLVANAVMLPIAGWLGSRLGHKRTIILGLSIFTFGAFLGSIAQNFESLVIFRALQGMGDGPILPITYALLFETFPEKERGRMMVINMLAVGVAPALAPLLASQLVQLVGWRSVFYLSVFLGLLSLTAVAALLPTVKKKAEKVKLNWGLFLLLAVGTGSLQLLFDRGQHYNWFESQSMVILFVVSITALLIFLTGSLLVKDKSVLDLSTLKDKYFLVGNIANMILFTVIYGAMIMKILYLQWLMNYTSGMVGIYQALLVGVMMLFSVFAGILTDKVHPKWSVIIGLPITFYALLLSSRLTLQNDMNSILIVGAFLATGVAFIMIPISVTIFSTVKKTLIKEATVVNSYFSVISMSISMALLTTFLMHRMDVNAINLMNIVDVGNLRVRETIAGLGHELGLVAIYEEMMMQSAMFSFNDVFLLLAALLVVFLLYLPFIKRAGSEE